MKLLLDKLSMARNIIVLQVKKIINKPDEFIFISKDQEGNYLLPEEYSIVKEIGPLQNVSHLTFHDMMPHAINSKMTDLKYLKGQDANAVYRSKFERLDKSHGRTYFQPLKLSK